MAISKSMDFPNSKKSAYAEQVEQLQQVSPMSNGNYIPVPGPSGPMGERGSTGPHGSSGEQGKSGDSGPRGARGYSGKDGLSSVSSSGQQAGWATYYNLKRDVVKLGINMGENGWVPMYVDGKGKQTNKKFLPERAIALWNPESRRVHLAGIKEGSQVFVNYGFELTTFSNNTELWVKTEFPQAGIDIAKYVASLKYQDTYNMSVDQHFFIENPQMISVGAIPKIRADFDCTLIMNSISISVL